MLLHPSAWRAAGAAGVNDAGRVFAFERPFGMGRVRRYVHIRPGDKRRPVMKVNPGGLANANILNGDHVTRVGSTDGGWHDRLRQLCCRQNNGGCARILHDMLMIAFAIGGVGGHGDTSGGHDFPDRQWPIRWFSETSMTRSPRLRPSASSPAASEATWRAASFQLIACHTPSFLPDRNGRSPSPACRPADVVMKLAPDAKRKCDLI